METINKLYAHVDAHEQSAMLLLQQQASSEEDITQLHVHDSTIADMLTVFNALAGEINLNWLDIASTVFERACFSKVDDQLRYAIDSSPTLFTLWMWRKGEEFEAHLTLQNRKPDDIEAHEGVERYTFKAGATKLDHELSPLHIKLLNSDLFRETYCEFLEWIACEAKGVHALLNNPV